MPIRRIRPTCHLRSASSAADGKPAKIPLSNFFVVRRHVSHPATLSRWTASLCHRWTLHFTAWICGIRTRKWLAPRNFMTPVHQSSARRCWRGVCPCRGTAAFALFPRSVRAREVRLAVRRCSAEAATSALSCRCHRDRNGRDVVCLRAVNSGACSRDATFSFEVRATREKFSRLASNAGKCPLPVARRDKLARLPLTPSPRQRDLEVEGVGPVRHREDPNEVLLRLVHCGLVEPDGC